MFGGKKEKELQQHLAELKEKNEKNEWALEQVRGQEDHLEEQFSKLAVSHTQMEKEIDMVKNNLQKIQEIRRVQSVSARALKEETLHLTDAARKEEEDIQLFFDNMRDQNGKITQIVEKNKHFTTPMKTLLELPEVFSEAQGKIEKELDSMEQCAKNMTVLSLNAAIEAGRMGDNGRQFVLAAEQIRSSSEAYDKSAAEIKSRMDELAKEIAQAKEQMNYLNELLKENNISMGKVYKEHTAHNDRYIKQKEDREAIRPQLVTQSLNQLVEGNKEFEEATDRMNLQMEDIGVQFHEQRGYAGEIEQIFSRISTTVQKDRETEPKTNE